MIESSELKPIVKKLVLSMGYKYSNAKLINISNENIQINYLDVINWFNEFFGLRGHVLLDIDKSDLFISQHTYEIFRENGELIVTGESSVDYFGIYNKLITKLCSIGKSDKLKMFFNLRHYYLSKEHNNILVNSQRYTLNLMTTMLKHINTDYGSNIRLNRAAQMVLDHSDHDETLTIDKNLLNVFIDNSVKASIDKSINDLIVSSIKHKDSYSLILKNVLAKYPKTEVTKIKDLYNEKLEECKKQEDITEEK